MACHWPSHHDRAQVDSDALYATLRAVRTWNRTVPLGAWISLNVRWQLLERRRQDAARPAVRLAVDPVVDDRTEQVHDTLLVAEIKQAINRTLPQRDGDILWMRLVEGCTVRQIARWVDVTPSRVSQILKDGCARVREALGV